MCALFIADTIEQFWLLSLFKIDLIGSFDDLYMCHQIIFFVALVSAFIVLSCEAEYDCHQNIPSVAVVSVPHGPQL